MKYLYKPLLVCLFVSQLVYNTSGASTRYENPENAPETQTINGVFFNIQRCEDGSRKISITPAHYDNSAQYEKPPTKRPCLKRAEPGPNPLGISALLAVDGKTQASVKKSGDTKSIHIPAQTWTLIRRMGSEKTFVEIFNAPHPDSTAYAVGYYPTGDFGLLYVKKKSSDFL